MADPLDGLFDGFNTELDPNAKNHSRPDLGRGAYMLARFWIKETFKQGNVLIADLITVQPAQGSTRAAGDKVSLAWCISKPGLAGQYEKARAAQFVAGLLGMPPKSDTGAAARHLRGDTQPGTGIIVYITGEQNGQYLNHKFDHVPGQTGEIIAANRAKVIAMAPAGPPPAAANPTHANAPGNVTAPPALPGFGTTAPPTAPDPTPAAGFSFGNIKF